MMGNGPIQSGENGDERGPDGRFVRGCKGGPGRGVDGQVAKLRQAAMQACPPARIRKIFDALARKAERGDVKAAAVVLPYLLGRPGDVGLCELEASADAAAAEAADLQGFGL